MDASIEIGWIVTNKDSDEYVGPLFENAEEDENGFFVPDTEDHPDGTDPSCLYIETHPHDEKRVFVSWCTPDHGFRLDGVVEPRGLSCEVRDYLKKLDPEAVVEFGVIETKR